MIIFYDNDPDGVCACHLLLKAFSEKKIPLTDKIPLKHQAGDRSKPFPHNLIKDNEVVIFTDYCAEPEDLKKIFAKTDNVVVLDHHSTTIEKNKGFKLKGIQRTDKASCELAWEWCWGDKKQPEYLQLIGDFDCWRENREEGYKLALALGRFELKPESAIWEVCQTKLEGLKTIGNLLYEAQQKSFDEKLTKIFKIKFEGYDALAINHNDRGAWCFENHPDKDKVDILFSFHYDGQQWAFSIFSPDDKVDVSKIAVKYGGGGHKSAAGFRVAKLPFKLD